MANDGPSSELQSEPSSPSTAEVQPALFSDAAPAESADTDVPPSPQAPEPDADSVLSAEKKPKKSRGAIVVIVLLALAFLVAIALFVFASIRLEQALDIVELRDQKINEQSELIDEKQTFGLAMDNLMSVVAEYEGVRVGGLVHLERYEGWAQQTWKDRWDAQEVREDTIRVEETSMALDEALAAAKVNASTNTTGTTMEAVTDSLGMGFASSALDDADTLCGQDVAGCVTSDDPYTAHYDAESDKRPYVNKWLRTGLAYHEYAHVLQFTNPEATEKAVGAFTASATADAPDYEIMADCFALTFLDGWEIEQTVWVSAYEYWEITGYGYTCNASQKQIIRDWYAAIAFIPRTVTQ